MIEKLNATWTDGSKLMKVGDRLRDQCECVEPKSARFEKSLDELSEGLMSLDQHMAGLGFLLKHKKTTKGEKLDLPTAQSSQRAVAAAMHDVLEASRAMKAIMPKKATAT